MDGWPWLAELAAQQYGAVTVEQSRAAGLDRTTLYRTAKRQGWQRPARGVYRVGGVPDRPELRLAEALLAVGPPALVAGWSAAWLWGLVRAAPSLPQLIVPHQRRGTGRRGMEVRRSRTLVDSDGVLHRGLPITTPQRMLCDLAADMDIDALRALVIDARQRRLVTLEQITQRAVDLGTVKGLGRLRQVLWELDAERCDSVLEWRIRELLAKAGLTPAAEPVAVPVPGHVLHVDIAWPDRKVGIEVDGFGSHSDRHSLQLDQRRHNALLLAGWSVLRAGWSEAGSGFPRLLQELQTLLQEASAR